MHRTIQNLYSSCKVLPSVDSELQEGRGLGWELVAHFGWVGEGTSRERDFPAVSSVLYLHRTVPPGHLDESLQLWASSHPRGAHTSPNYGLFAGGEALGTMRALETSWTFINVCWPEYLERLLGSGTLSRRKGRQGRGRTEEPSPTLTFHLLPLAPRYLAIGPSPSADAPVRSPGLATSTGDPRKSHFF